MLVQGKDGEMRLNEFGLNGTTYYLSVLFHNMDFSGPTSRPRSEETLIMDRGNFDSNAHFIQGNSEPRYSPLDISFSCKLADTANSAVLLDWLSGLTTVGIYGQSTTRIYSYDGQALGSVDGNTIPAFADSGKQRYRAEVLWDGTSDLSYRYDQVYFPPGEITITESEDGLTLNASGKVYGDVTRITSFYAGTAII